MLVLEASSAVGGSAARAGAISSRAKSSPPPEIGISALRHAVKPTSDALKPKLIRRAVSTLVYATLLHPFQGLLPMNLHPPESAGLGAGGLAGALLAAAMLEQIQP